MSSKLIRVVVAASVLACAGVLSAVASGRPKAEPKLEIVSGSAKVTSRAGARPVLWATFVVANAGTAVAKRFAGRLELTATGHTLTMRRYSGGPLKTRHRITLTTRLKVPQGLAKLDWAIEACVTDCRRLGSYDLAPRVNSVGSTPTPTTASQPTTVPSTPPTTSSTTTSAPPSSPPVPTTTPQVPTSPITDYDTDTPYFVADGLGQYDGYANADGTDADHYYDDASGGFFTSGYWAVVPPSYDASNQTPETLVVWMHGCGGAAAWDAQDLTGQFNTDRPYILISLNGPENANNAPDTAPDCWDTGDDTDSQKVLTDIANVETHFNIDRRRVILAGYSSGGDLAYQTIFEHADTFAGLLAMNTDPVRDNAFNDDIDSAIAAAAWKFPIIHVAHDMDDTYPTSEVGPHMNALTNAGFDVSYSVLPGTHYDADQPDDCNDTTPGTCTSGTPYDIVHHLLSTVASDGWESPAS